MDVPQEARPDPLWTCRLVPVLRGLDAATCRAVLDDMQPTRTLGLVAGIPVALIVGIGLWLGGEEFLERALGRGTPWLDIQTAEGRLATALGGAAVLFIAALAAFVPVIAVLRVSIRSRLHAAACPSCGGRTAFRFRGGRSVCLSCGRDDRGERVAASPAAEPEDRVHVTPLVAALALTPAALCGVLWLVAGFGFFRDFTFALGAVGIVGLLTVNRRRPVTIAAYAVSAAATLAAWIATGNEAWWFCAVAMILFGADRLGLLPASSPRSARHGAEAPLDPAHR